MRARTRSCIIVLAALIVCGVAELAAGYYSPRMGRFISRDPIGESGGLNLCAYVLNEPVARIDPHGRCSAGLIMCGFQDGVPHITVFENLGPCTKAVAWIHEGVHFVQQADCCAKAAAKIKQTAPNDAAARQQIMTAYTNWLTANKERDECVAYATSLAAGINALASQCCLDRGQLAQGIRIDAVEMARSCLHMKPPAPCPF